MNLRAALKSRHSYAIAVLIAAIIVTDTFNTSTRRMFIFHPSRDTSHSLPFGNIKPDTQLSNRQQWLFRAFIFMRADCVDYIRCRRKR